MIPATLDPCQAANHALSDAVAALSDLSDYFTSHRVHPAGAAVTGLTRGGTLTVKVTGTGDAEHIAAALGLHQDQAQVPYGRCWARWYTGSSEILDYRVMVVTVAEFRDPALRDASVADSDTVSAVLAVVAL